MYNLNIKQIKKKIISVIGIVGLPANYGGFETLVENLSLHQFSQIDLVVYCSSRSYSNKLKVYNNAILKYIPLNANGIESIFYDIFSIIHALTYSDSILILGVSGCFILPFVRFFTKKKVLINIDGIEWKRNKWGYFAKFFLRFSEKIAIRYGNVIIADNEEIVNYIREKYNKDSILIPYGGDHNERMQITNEVYKIYPFLTQKYAFNVCRIEPENNIEMILNAFALNSNLNLVIVGNWNSSQYGLNLRNKFNGFPNIYLIDSIYDRNTLNQIRSNCYLYIHGHSAGGTNPSLVEAMSLKLPIFAFNCSFNKATTENKCLYFSNSQELYNLIINIKSHDLNCISMEMLKLAQLNYKWSLITSKYQDLFQKY